MDINSSESDIRSPSHQLKRLVEWFTKFSSCLVAFSSGVDSSLLAYAASEALGDRAIAVTSQSVSFAQSEMEAAKAVSKEIGIRLVVVDQNDLKTEGYVANQVNRCYFCRSNLVHAIIPIINQMNIEVCVDGTHLDDMRTPRPGVKALREAGFRAPFVELGMRKEDIRAVARHVGLSNAERPSEACLSSRIAYGHKIDLKTLRMIEEAEACVREITGAKIVRVRTIGRDALLELDQDSIEAGMSKKQSIEEKLRSLGYEQVEIDPKGYVSGKMLQLFIKHGS